jgi:transmembrane sensor
MPSAVEAQVSQRRPRLARWWPALGLAASLALVAGLAWRRGAAPGTDTPSRYETVVGVQQKIGLPDGSELQLNTDSAVSIRFDAQKRWVKLERGEAFFRVKKDATRPFIVAAGRAEARVLGTAFVVRWRETGTEVLVSEGKVRFGATPASGVNLGANMHAVLGTGATAPTVKVLEPAEVARRLAWQDGRLEFKDTPVSEAVAEFNRYNRRRLVVRDAATGVVPIGGAILADNLAGFVGVLETFGVVVVDQDAVEIVLGLKP